MNNYGLKNFAGWMAIAVIHLSLLVMYIYLNESLNDTLKFYSFFLKLEAKVPLPATQGIFYYTTDVLP